MVEILGIARVDKSRVWLPLAVRSALEKKDRVGVAAESKRIVLGVGRERHIDEQGRLKLSASILKGIGAEDGTKLIFLKEDDGRITISRLEDRVR
jgi:DNA-binding transcriptional regulator/RsmH inhibitor MraZ